MSPAAVRATTRPGGRRGPRTAIAMETGAAVARISHCGDELLDAPGHELAARSRCFSDAAGGGVVTATTHPATPTGRLQAGEGHQFTRPMQDVSPVQVTIAPTGRFARATRRPEPSAGGAGRPR